MPAAISCAARVSKKGAADGRTDTRRTATKGAIKEPLDDLTQHHITDSHTYDARVRDAGMSKTIGAANRHSIVATREDDLAMRQTDYTGRYVCLL